MSHVNVGHVGGKTEIVGNVNVGHMNVGHVGGKTEIVGPAGCALCAHAGCAAA